MISVQSRDEGALLGSNSSLAFSLSSRLKIFPD